jgi:His/Glu/Gln/Arg/opine family amino acid ABC transporter permease subunit
MEFLTKVSELGGPLLLGAVTTVWITLASLAVAVVLGLGLALIRLLGFRALNALIATYVEIFRNTPVLAQLFIIYLRLPTFGINIDPVPAASRRSRRPRSCSGRVIW